MKRSKLIIVAVLSLLLITMMIPEVASAATSTSYFKVNKTTTLRVPSKLTNCINESCCFKFTNSILPFSDKTSLSFNRITGQKYYYYMQITSNNGKTYRYPASGTQKVDSQLKFSDTLSGAFGYNTKSVKVVIKGVINDRSDTWTIIGTK